MINGVNGVRVNNTQPSFKKTIEGVEVANNVRKATNDYTHNNLSVATKKNAIIEFMIKFFGGKKAEKCEEINYNMIDKYGYGHMSH